jgi:hypothetical protein
MSTFRSEQLSQPLSLSGSFTGSLAGTASWASNFVSASNYVLNSQTSSFVLNSQTSSFVLNSQTSSMTVATASYVTSSKVFGPYGANSILSASYAVTASHAINAKNGTVTSVAKLTLGTSGTDLSSTVANPTTTPVITLNVPDASASNRGVLTTSDWTNFNTAYTNRITSFTTNGTGVATFEFNVLNIPTPSALPEETHDNIILDTSNYQIENPGIFEIKAASDTYSISFPDPNASIGARITIINTDSVFPILVDNPPYSLGTANQITEFAPLSYYQFVSINGKWRGGQLLNP